MLAPAALGLAVVRAPRVSLEGVARVVPGVILLCLRIPDPGSVRHDSAKGFRRCRLVDCVKRVGETPTE